MFSNKQSFKAVKFIYSRNLGFVPSQYYEPFELAVVFENWMRRKYSWMWSGSDWFCEEPICAA